MKRTALLAVLALVLSACAYTYIPPIPEIRTAEPRLDVRDSPGLRLDEGSLRLAVRLNRVPEEGWLAVQWFSARNREVGSSSVWISPESEGTVQTFFLPADVPVSDGLWRALLSFEGQVLRQFALEVGAQ